MSQNFRQERIERLLQELRYEIERGMMEREIDETIGFTFFVPISSVLHDGVVHCEFRTRPVPRYYVPGDYLQNGPHLKVISGGKS